MKFITIASSEWGANNLLKRYPCLNNYSPVFIIIDRNKRLLITIESFDHISELIKDLNDTPVIVYQNYDYEGTADPYLTLEIYDDYRE